MEIEDSSDFLSSSNNEGSGKKTRKKKTSSESFYDNNIPRQLVQFQKRVSENIPISESKIHFDSVKLEKGKPFLPNLLKYSKDRNIKDFEPVKGNIFFQFMNMFAQYFKMNTNVVSKMILWMHQIFLFHLPTESNPTLALFKSVIRVMELPSFFQLNADGFSFLIFYLLLRNENQYSEESYKKFLLFINKSSSLIKSFEDIFKAIKNQPIPVGEDILGFKEEKSKEETLETITNKTIKTLLKSSSPNLLIYLITLLGEIFNVNVAIKNLETNESPTYFENLLWKTTERNYKFNTLWFIEEKGQWKFHSNSFYSLKSIPSNLKKLFETNLLRKNIKESQMESEQSSASETISQKSETKSFIVEKAKIADQTFLATFYEILDSKNIENLKKFLNDIKEKLIQRRAIQSFRINQKVEERQEWFNLSQMNLISFFDSTDPISLTHEKLFHFVFVIFFGFYNLFVTRSLSFFESLLDVDNFSLSIVTKNEIKIVFSIMFIDIFVIRKFFDICRKNFDILEKRKTESFSQFFSSFTDPKTFLENFSTCCLENDLLRNYSIVSKISFNSKMLAEKKSPVTISLRDQIAAKNAIVNVSFEPFQFFEYVEQFKSPQDIINYENLDVRLTTWMNLMTFPLILSEELKKDTAEKENYKVLVQLEGLFNKNFRKPITKKENFQNLDGILKDKDIGSTLLDKDGQNLYVYLNIMLRIQGLSEQSKKLSKFKLTSEDDSDDIDELRKTMAYLYLKLFKYSNEKLLKEGFKYVPNFLQKNTKIINSTNNWNLEMSNRQPYLSVNFTDNPEAVINKELTLFPTPIKIEKSQNDAFDLKNSLVRKDIFKNNDNQITAEHEYLTSFDEPYILDFTNNLQSSFKQKIVPRYFIPFQIENKKSGLSPRKYSDITYQCSLNKYQWSSGFGLMNGRLISMILVEKRIYIMNLATKDPLKRVSFESFQEYYDENIITISSSLNPPLTIDTFDFSKIVSATFRYFFEKNTDISSNIFSHIYNHCSV